MFVPTGRRVTVLSAEPTRMSPLASTTDFGTAPSARSYADLTAVGVAASTLLVVLVESESCTAPAAEVDAAAIEIAGVAPPEDAIGAVPVTEDTPPEAAAHLSPVTSAESAVRT